VYQEKIITNNLISQGWQRSDVDEGFSSIDSSNTSSQISSPQSFSTLPQQPERKVNKTLLAIISIIGVLIIGSGVFGYFYYFQETPEKVIEKMRARLTEVKTLEYQGDIKAEVTTPDLLGGGSLQPAQQTPSKKASDFSINFSGKSDVSDLNNPKGSFAFNIKTDALKELTQGDTTFGLEVRTINKVVYVKLNNLPNLGFFDLSFLSNQWIKIDTEAIKKQFGLEKFEAQIKEAPKQQGLTPEQTEKLKQVVAQTKVFKVTEKLASEEIEGINTHHYKFLIDKNELKKLITDISAIVQNKTLTDEELAELDKGLEAIESLGGEIWIGKKDYLPYKIIFTVGIKETTESKTAGQLTATLSFKNYDKPVQIDIPSPVKSIEEIMSQSLNTQNAGTPQTENIKQFNDAELGVSFSFPKTWGDVQKSTTAHISSVPFDLQHQFNFSQNSSIIAEVNYLGEPDVFRQHADYDKALKEKNDPTEEFCKPNLEYSSPYDDSNPVGSNQPHRPHSSFRQNGTYDYGVCKDEIISFVKAVKENGKIKVSKTYVIMTGNQSYSPLEISYKIELDSNDYWDGGATFYMGAQFEGTPRTEYKNFNTITYEDKDLIDNAIKSFQNSELNKELEQLVNSLSVKIVSEQDANNFIENYFKPKSQYSSDKIGVKFEYPSILPEPVLGKDEKSISIDGFELIKVILRQGAVAEEKSAAECEGMCFGPSITADQWDLHFDILTKGIIDKEKCKDCESIVTIGNNKFLVLFQGGAGYSGHPGKRYIIYQKGKRYEFNGFQNSFTLSTGFTLSEFDKMSDKSIMQKTVKNIIGSVSFN